MSKDAAEKVRKRVRQKQEKEIDRLAGEELQKVSFLVGHNSNLIQGHLGNYLNLNKLKKMGGLLKSDKNKRKRSTDLPDKSIKR
jgi:hypothetical protein